MKNRIRELREELNMTQTRLSIELEVSQETVSSYENQKHFPSFLQLTKMANLFNTSIDYMMGLSDVRNPECQKKIKNTNLVLVNNLCQKLSDKQLELVLAYIRGMLDFSKLGE